MNVEHNRALQQHLAPLLKREGFRKHHATWWKDYADSIAVFNIQGSRFGPTLFINLGIYYRAHGSESQPREVDCHLRTRLNSIATDAMTVIKLLEYSNAFGEEVPLATRHRMLEQIVATEALPWLERCSTLGGAQSEATHKPRSFWIAPVLRPLISASLDD